MGVQKNDFTFRREYFANEPVDKQANEKQVYG